MDRETDRRANAILKKYFGYDEFREGQEAVIANILSGRDVLAIMPTGAGKSICYQVPALAFDGLTVVISPLISLMKDQVSGLLESGVKAALLNSSLTAGEYSNVLRRAARNEYKLLYVAPERLLLAEFLALAAGLPISMITVDEAHCVSQWGQDFRPAYLDITRFVETLENRPVLSAFTATATNKVRDDIVSLLRLKDPYLISTGFDRRNLHFSVKKPQDKLRALLSYLDANKGKSGIVYCATRKTVEEVCAALCEKGYAAVRYHAGLDERERRESQDDFLYDRCSVIVATNAFGMGIDKSNVGFVVHFNMPKNIESYYQEAGRAGRDGSPADCVLLYGSRDVRTNRFLIQKGLEANEELSPEERASLQQKDEELLKAMTWYCHSTDCLRGYILKYFGENAPGYCGNCENCNTNFESADVTLEAKKIISCIYRLDERRRSFGKSMVAQILHGSRNERILQQKLDTLSTYGIMADQPIRRIYDITDHLIREGYLLVSEGEYPLLRLAPSYAEITRGARSVLMKLPKYAPPEASLPKGKDAPKGAGDAMDATLFQRLRALRSRLAAAAEVPAFVVFSDAALRDMCRLLPQDEESFLAVSGVGKRKAEQYGEVFTAVIGEYLAERRAADPGAK
ncbi:MAG: DNA helicase RecQ [Clostridiales Family XIII bacterium]|jgi:ATP-dependent DNA helicase RecQ|nr:DNA helicase RecQ [Clostridiales Family XIII bacterium]